VSSNSDSDSDSDSDKKASGKRKKIEANKGQAPKKKKPKQSTSASASAQKKKPKQSKSTAASAMQRPSVAQVDYGALLPRMAMTFGTELFLNFMLGKFPVHVSNDDILGFCYAYNLNEIPEKVFMGYEPFFGALKIYTLGVEKHMKYFQLLKDSKYTSYLYIYYAFVIHHI
jgi:hypothetical protein